jgi:polysaccharide deacetylase family protein (PEP-CTERM system associated)
MQDASIPLPSGPEPAASRYESGKTVRNAFTVDVEEYFQVEAFSGFVREEDWNRYPFRVVEQTERILDLIDSFLVRGTFFILGWLAERNPALVRRIRDAGHEIASHGFGHRMLTRMTPEEFRKDVRDSKAVLEGIAGQEIRGYRAPTFSILEKTSWAYEILLEEGFRYSSSVFPVWHDRYGWPGFGDDPRRMAAGGNGEIWEIPMAVGSLGPLKIPFGGGGYLRTYPLPLTQALFRSHERRGKHAVLYIHPWELDPDLPVLRAPLSTRIRHYNGIAGAQRKLAADLRAIPFGTVAQLLESYRGAESARNEQSRRE